ncbi:hypothetical protein KIN20_021872 [Parelaphostrongylus tenuis]|uniref:Uncharacterized protein n=1 Tax=Parelaphostrongylus tenuis TaxID=148309 RepID=A0AAD5QUT7_PARTN|nr:hypothetical protein KIN20_021872 [Parelaphostrongylus tenuis]
MVTTIKTTRYDIPPKDYKEMSDKEERDSSVSAQENENEKTDSVADARQSPLKGYPVVTEAIVTGVHEEVPDHMEYIEKRYEEQSPMVEQSPSHGVPHENIQ